MSKVQMLDALGNASGTGENQRNPMEYERKGDC